MSVLIKTGGIEMEKFDREPLPEEGRAGGDGGPGGAGRRRPGSDRSDLGMIERNRLSIKFTSSDDALRKILTDLANHKEQLFIIRNVSVQNKMTDSPPRVSGAPTSPPAPGSGPGAPGTPGTLGTPATPGTPAVPGAPPAPVQPAPVIESPVIPAVPTPAAAIPAPPVNEGPLTYVFGTEKITSSIEIEILNIGEPKAKSEKPEKGGKKKEK
jgi:hypothetical protein